MVEFPEMNCAAGIGGLRMKIVDFRARPLVPEYAAYLRPRLAAIRAETGGYGAYDAPEQDIAGFVASLGEAGIDIAVFAARNRVSDAPDWPLTNDLVAAAAREHPKRVVPFGGLDLSDIPWSLNEMKRCVADHGFRGFCIDPFQIGARADDDRIGPLYEFAESAGVAVVVTMGGMPGIPQPLHTGDPIALDEIAQSHPDLILIGSHSGWPFVTTMIAVAWRRPNVYFENSFYHFAPGAEPLVDAANQMIGDKMLYASAYPFAPLDGLDGFRRLPFRPEILEKVIGGNAMGLLARIGALPSSEAG
jgi:predicted TIM-barrel fold metal-dependent hydrolase